MNPSAVNIAVIDGKTITQSAELRTEKMGQPVRIKAVKGGHYLLAEGEKGAAPENVTVKRVGKDLHLSLEGTDLDQPQLIIEDYYGSDSQLVGMAEDGNYYDYIASDAEQDQEAAFLLDGDSSAQVLGATPLVGFANGLVAAAGIGFWPAVLGLGALAAAGFAVGKIIDNNNGGGSGGGGTVPPALTIPDQPVLEGVIDDVGDVTGEIENGGVTDDTQPTFTGTGEPGNSVVVIDNGKVIGEVVIGEDGKWEFTPETPLAEGDHSVVVVERAPDGGTSAPTDPFEFEVDVTAPARSVISSVVDDFGDDVGPIANNGTTDDTTPTINGTAEAGARVDILNNGVKIGETIADADGNWTFTPETPLAGGTYVLTSVAVDKSGNIGLPSLPHTITITTDTPEKGVIGEVIDNEGSITGPIENGDTTDDTTPTFNGEGTPGDKVSVIIDGENVGEVEVGDDGRWTYTPEVPLEEGSHEVVVVITNPGGTPGEPSDPWVIIVDTTAPEAPVIGGVYDDQGDVQDFLNPGDITDDARPTITGTAEPGSQVIIKDNGQEIGRVEVDADGNWSFEPELPLVNGPHELTVEAVDKSGNVSEPSDPFDFVLEAGGAPTAPAITGMFDDVGSITGNISPDGVTDDARPTIQGTGQAGSIVSIYDGATLLGTAQVNAEGRWEFTPDTDLADGRHLITANASNGPGNVSPTTGAYPVVIDTTPPEAAGDQVLSDNVGQMQGPIASGDTTDDDTPTFTGTAEPGATVHIFDNGVPLGTALVAEDGTWSFTPSPALADGPHSLSTQVVDKAGNESTVSTPIDFTVDTSAIVVSIGHISDNAGPITDNLASGDTTDDTTPTLHGRGTPGGIVTVYIDGVANGTAVVNAAGEWQYSVTPALAEGDYVFTATVTTDATGESAPTGDFNLAIDTTAPGTPAIGAVTDDVGEIQGPLENGATTDDTTPTLSGGGLEPGDKVDIYDNGELIGSADVGPDGTWSFTPNPPLNNGEHELTIIAQDPSGNRSEESDPWTIIVDTVAPNAPVITSVYDDQGDRQENLTPGDVTDDARPTLSGTAEPGTEVIIYANGVEVGRAQVDSDGNWTGEPTLPLGNGPQELTVKAVDTAGNVSEPSDPFGIDVLAGGASTVPQITGVLDDVGTPENISPEGLTNDPTPTVQGIGAPGNVISVSINGVVAGTALVAADGTWSFTPDANLADGRHVITATATDPLTGNSSAATGPYPVIIDTTPPAAAGDLELQDNVGPIQDPIVSGDTTDDDTPTFVGTAEPGATVHIFDNGVPLGTALVGEDGTWSFTPTPALVDGPHSLSTQVVDRAGNVSPVSTPIDFTVDTSAVEVSIGHISDNVGPITDNLVSGDVTDDTTPTLHGRGTPGGTVTVYIDGVANGTATVGANGEWQYSVTPALAEGNYVFTATVTTPANGESDPTAEFNLEIDTTAPGVPGEPGENPTAVIGAITDDVGENQGPLTDGDYTDDTTPTLSGGGLQPGDKVDIYDNGELIGRADVGPDGSWSFTPNPPLNEGEHVFTVVAEDIPGNRSEPSEPWTIIVDTTPPTAPTIDSVYDDQGDRQENLTPGDTTDDARPTISGSAEIGSTHVIIYDNGVAIGTAVVNADGSWTFEPVLPLVNGAHELTVKAVDQAGNVSDPSDPFGFDLLAGAASTPPQITGVLDDVGTPENIAPEGLTNDPTPTVQGIGAPGNVISVSINGVVAGTALVAADGTWSFTPDANLADGRHVITATATDPLTGNISAATGPYPVIVDTTPPAAAGDLELQDNVGPIQDPIVSGDVTDDDTPTFVGTAEPGATVNVFDNGVLLGSADVAADGTWSFTPSPALANGPHSLSTQVVDKAGNASPVSTPIDFTIDTSAVEVSISHIADDVGPITDNLVSGDVTDDTTPTLHGRGTPGGTVTVYIDGVANGTAVVGANGEWQYSVTPALAEGDYVFTATVTTPANGESDPSAGFNLEIDTTAPMAPGAPAIGSITDDVGDSQGLLADGDATDDTTPTLRGSGLQPGDKVDVYSNGQLLGRTDVQADGTWSFTPNPPLNEGEQVFTIIAEDIPGNRSEESDPWTVVIDTTAPEAQAVVTSMGKDSGSDSTDFVTNDGTAGRLIQGTLTAALATGEKVQVSTDGGVSWLDALLNGDGTWSFIDQNSHSDGWEIQTRVIDLAGNATVSSQAVELDQTPPDAPSSLAVNENSVEVGFSATGAQAGDIVNVLWGDSSIDYMLDAADVMRGSVVISIPDEILSLDPTPEKVAVGLVDSVGNVSDYLTKTSGVGGLDFVGRTFNELVVSGVEVRQGFTMTVEVNGATSASNGFPNGDAMHVARNSVIDVKSDTPMTGKVVMWFGMVHGWNYIDFYDSNGDVILHQGILISNGGFWPNEFELPSAAAGFKIHTGSEAAQSDSGIIWGGVEMEVERYDVVPPQDAFDVDVGSGSYHGGEGDSVFAIGDVNYFNGVHSGVNGGDGVDSIVLLGAGQELNLTSLADRITSIEVIDLTGTGDNTLKLSLNDILNQGETDLFHESGKVQMMIKGDAGDVVDLDGLLGGEDPGTWGSLGQVTVAGVVYDVYQHSAMDAELLVQQGVTTNFV